MDLGEKDKLDLERKNGVPLNYHSPNISSNWQFSRGNHSNLSMGLVPRERDPIGSSVLVADPYHPNLWNDRNSQNLGCGDSNVGATASVMAPEKGVCETLRTGSTNKAMDLDWNTPKQNGFLQTADRSGTQTSSDYPADSAFTERASRFSSFNAGSFGDIVNPFNIPETGMMINGQNMALGSHDVGGSVEGGTAEGSLMKGYVSPCDETSKECNEAEASDSGHHVETSMLQADGLHYAFEGQCVKKRKKPSQVMEVERTGGASQLRGESTKDHSGTKQKNGRNPNTTSKDHPKTLDTSKEDYIHIRARRGQATNSHSLAERVRREKISERMKYLQDLVPGCDKVTGKAVMLDEIINYVQSLQRQVEFLSMKLATVIPRLDHTIEGLLTKDIHQSQGSPSVFPFPSDANMVHTYLHPSQGSIQAGIPGIGNPLDALRRSVNSQLMSMGVGGYKDPNQVPNPWDDGLNNNVFPMNFGTNGAFNGQDLSSLPGEHMQVEF